MANGSHYKEGSDKLSTAVIYPDSIFISDLEEAVDMLAHSICR